MRTHQGASSRYQESQVLTAGREQLLLLTHDGILRFLARACQGMERRDYAEKHLGLTRAQALIIELWRTLDFSVSPELAHSLARLYAYLVEQVMRADAEDNIPIARHVMDLVAELRAAWLGAARQALVGECGRAGAGVGEEPSAQRRPVASGRRV